jgi:hypothetical protein
VVLHRPPRLLNSYVVDPDPNTDLAGSEIIILDPDPAGSEINGMTNVLTDSV